MIYHYCVIVEMFCIGLYARHTFRKVEPSLEVVDEPIRTCQTDRAVQTDSHATRDKTQLLSEEVQLGTSNPAFSGGEDTLCRIEHEPLDRFFFSRAKRAPTEQSRPEEAGTETQQNSSDITVV